MPDATTGSGTSITNTAAVGLSVSSGGTVLIWIIRMFEDGHINTPSAEVAMTLMAFLAPFIHAVTRVILRKIDPQPPDGAH